MTYCCELLRAHCEYRCPTHGTQTCPDQVIRRADDGTIGLPVHDGGSSYIAINYCPWCGTSLTRAIEEGVAWLDKHTPEPGVRMLHFGPLTASGRMLTPAGSWILAETHGQQTTSILVMDTAEAKHVYDEMTERLPS